MVPQPVKAVILVFPYGEISKSDARKAQEEKSAKDRESGKSEIDPTVVWIKQTIGNACGTMALLHALLNVRNSTFLRFDLLSVYISPDRCRVRPRVAPSKVHRPV